MSHYTKRGVNIYAAISQKGEVALAGYDGWPTHTNIFHDDDDVDVDCGGVGCDIINMMSLEDHIVEMMLTKTSQELRMLSRSLSVYKCLLVSTSVY